MNKVFGMADVEFALLIDRFMRRIHAAMQTKAQEFDAEKVGPGGGIVLLTLAELDFTSMQELTARVARDKSQMTRTVRQLDNKGLVQRRPSAEDARVCLVSLTPRGLTVVEEIKKALAETINEILTPITSQQKDTLKNLLNSALG